MKQQTIVNSYGEKIHVKILNEEVLIHHEDATDDYIPYDQFKTQVILNQEEMSSIRETIKTLQIN